MKHNVLLTGAGSLGEAFIKLLHKKCNITVIEQSEWTVARLSKEYPDVKFILEDFVEWKFDQDPVEYIIHTAAYKHLPLGEENPNSFIDNNIIKLRKLFAEAYKHNVQLLFVSTDKAVEPCSLYGYTKAIGEVLAKYYNFSIARLGNILNSSGSVIPVWEDCILNKKPIPITDERMVRYFCNDDEAVKEIWTRFVEGEHLIIPKTEKITIYELLVKTLAKYNKYIADVDIEEIGIRKGEKIEERLMWPEEEA